MYCIVISMFFVACVKKAENKDTEVLAAIHFGKTLKYMHKMRIR